MPGLRPRAGRRAGAEVGRRPLCYLMPARESPVETQHSAQTEGSVALGAAGMVPGAPHERRHGSTAPAPKQGTLPTGESPPSAPVGLGGLALVLGLEGRSRNVLDAQKDLTAVQRRQNDTAADRLLAWAAYRYAAGLGGAEERDGTMP